MLHLKGSGAVGVGPKFVKRDMPLKQTCGKSVLPSNSSGSGSGCVARWPSLNKLMVLKFGLSLSKFKSTPTTESRVILPPVGVRLVLWRAKPSASKQKLSAEPRISEEPAVEKPTFKASLLFLTAPGVSGVLTCSIIFTSKRYRPLLMPTLARAPAWKCCMAPSFSDIKMPLADVSVLSVVSAVKNATGSVFFDFHGAPSVSNSLGGSGTFGVSASFGFSSSFISTSFPFSSAIFCFFSAGAMVVRGKAAKEQRAKTIWSGGGRGMRSEASRP
mmetsp:Transcript_141581/g.452245  ORF Transcript_141581/g.452245 Transcript_141581/m.452245 type:complete len:273 (-) Transcript_141581:19-837(-)